MGSLPANFQNYSRFKGLHKIARQQHIEYPHIYCDTCSRHLRICSGSPNILADCIWKGVHPTPLSLSLYIYIYIYACVCVCVCVCMCACMLVYMLVYMPCGVGHITKNSTNVFSACRKRRLKVMGRGDWESPPL